MKRKTPPGDCPAESEAIPTAPSDSDDAASGHGIVSGLNSPPAIVEPAAHLARAHQAPFASVASDSDIVDNSLPSPGTCTSPANNPFAVVRSAATTETIARLASVTTQMPLQERHGRPGPARFAASFWEPEGTLEGVSNMSTAGALESMTVSVYESCFKTQRFVIPQVLLVDKDVGFGAQADAAILFPFSDVTLHNVNIEAFNLFVMWLHGLKLPEVTELAPVENFNNGPDFVPTLIDETQLSGIQTQAFHICFMDAYKQHSVEEMQLESYKMDERNCNTTSRSGTAGAGANGSNASPGLVRDPFMPGAGILNANLPSALPTQPLAAVTAAAQTSRKSKSFRTRAEGRRDNEKIQTLLLQLALLAHRYKWTDCFNTAMDLYRTGERRLDRSLPKPEHVNMAYLNGALGSTPIKRFMADYAFFRSIDLGIAQLVSNTLCHNHAFMEYFMGRLLGTVQVLGTTVTSLGNGFMVQTQRQSNTTVLPSNPLDDVNAASYHML